MSSDFVRHTPEIEIIDPDIDDLLPQIIELWEMKGREPPRTDGTGRAVRGAHAKAIGGVKVEVEILHEVPAPYAHGLYAKPGRRGALIRISSAASHPGPDAQLGPVLGFAIKIFDVDGPKLVEDEPNSKAFDLVLKNRPLVIANAAKHFDKGDALAFNPWSVTAEHRPLGEIMEVRRIYAASAKVRRTLNHQPQTEPNSADEVLA